MLDSEEETGTGMVKAVLKVSCFSLSFSAQKWVLPDAAVAVVGLVALLGLLRLSFSLLSDMPLQKRRG